MEESIKEILKLCKNNTKLIAVSKTKPIEDILRVYKQGIRDFGENKVQELLQKRKELPEDIKWHMIGHLQTNKVKDIIDKVELIHSVDTLKLANVINKEAIKKDIKVNILLEVNIGNEETKFGFHIDELDTNIKEIEKLPNINIKGLMCVAPNQEDNTKYFKMMKELNDKYNFKELSMGMSNDYKEAIKEGSTMIRIGTLIFGKRN